MPKTVGFAYLTSQESIRLKIAACQMPDVREEPATALSWMVMYAERAAIQGVGLLCFPECFLQGYLTKPEVARRNAIQLNSDAFASILQQLSHAKPMLVFGMIESEGDALYNTAVVVHGGRLIGRYRKVNLLPGEGVFTAGVEPLVFQAGELAFGINICSDTQIPELSSAVAAQGAKLIVCPANNMMKRENALFWKDRHNEIRACRAKETGLWLISSDITGEYGKSVGLGPTCVIDRDGQVVAQVPMMEVGMVVADI
ncbi:MAG: carbon-nitrogen hydrolase family protein [Candidatus Sumerlaeota bacterium]